MDLEARAEAADWITNHPVFIAVMEEAYSSALNTLLTADVGSLTASSAHATMKAITDIKNRFDQYSVDVKMRTKFGKGDHERRD